MRLAVALASSALRRLAVASFTRVTSSAGPALPQPLGASLDPHRPLARLLPPVYEPSRGYARSGKVIPSDEEEDEFDDELDGEDDIDGDFDGEKDLDGDWSEFDDGEKSSDESD